MRLSKRRLVGHLDPFMLPVASHFGIHNYQLPQAVGELWKLRLGSRILDGAIEAAKDLLKSIIVAFAVTVRQLGLGTRPVLQ
jgi:hypothetical protein